MLDKINPVPEYRRHSFHRIALSKVYIMSGPVESLLSDLTHSPKPGSLFGIPKTFEPLPSCP